MEHDLIQGVDYKFSFIYDPVCVELISGDYAGVVYRYSEVSASADEANPSLPPVLSFNFELVACRGFDPDELEDDYDFKERIGDVLISIITKE